MLCGLFFSFMQLWGVAGAVVHLYCPSHHNSAWHLMWAQWILFQLRKSVMSPLLKPELPLPLLVGLDSVSKKGRNTNEFLFSSKEGSNCSNHCHGASLEKLECRQNKTSGLPVLTAEWQVRRKQALKKMSLEECWPWNHPLVYLSINSFICPSMHSFIIHPTSSLSICSASQHSFTKYLLNMCLH